MTQWSVSSRGKLSLALASSLCLAALPACDGPPAAAVPAPSSVGTSAAPARSVEITIVGTSDLHGRLSTLPVLGGYLGALRARNPEGVLLVDAGDMFQGTLESNQNEGEAVIEAYKKLRYDAVAIGNHEFDYGPVGEASTVRRDAPEGPDRDPRGALAARALQAKGAFPVLAANLLENDRPFSHPNIVPSALVTKNGVPVGIIGVTSIGTTSTTIAANVVGVRVTPLAGAITEQAKALREKGAKVVVVAAHAGGQCKKLDAPKDLSSCDGAAEIFDVARALPEGTVQVIIAGHTHQAVAHEVSGIPIIQSNAYGVAFGRVDLTVDVSSGKVVRSKIFPPEQVARGASFEGVTIAPATDVEEALKPAIERAQARRAESLSAMVTAPFAARYRDECALGNLLTTLLLDLDPKADIALMNGGGLRADIAPGPLTYGALYDALPFDNRLATMTMTGRSLRAELVKNLTGKGGILSIAGARVTGRCEGDKLAVDVVLTGRNRPDRKLKDDDRVVAITNEFIATLGDGFGPADKVEIDEGGPPFRDPVAAALKKRGGTLKPEEWLLPGKPRISLPGPIGADVCKR